MEGLLSRDNELQILNGRMEDAKAGRGNAIFISGEPGIGKTMLSGAFKNNLESQQVAVLTGKADIVSSQPFLAISRALEGITARPIFEERELTRFVKIFVVNKAGLLVAQASSEIEDLDADIFAGMLSAVQDFVRDSFQQEGASQANLGRLEYGDMKILMEHGQHLYLTTVVKGGEHPDMKTAMKRSLQRIESDNSQLLEDWSGKVSDMAPVQEEIDRLAGIGFNVPKNLVGIRLDNERIRIADQVLELLKEKAGKNPLAVILEDLHWADESSLFVIRYLARNIRASPILVLGTMRPKESARLDELVEQMLAEETLDMLELRTFDVQATMSLINGTMSPNDFPETLAQKLFQQSRGNPLFVVEILRGMLDHSSIVQQNGKYSLVAEEYQVPASVEELVNRRLGALDPNSISMIEYASCIGQSFEADIVRSNRHLALPDESIDRLLASGILLRRNGTLEFSHAIFRSVVYDSIGERWKSAHHKSIGEYYEVAYENRLDEFAFELARHFSMTREHGKCSNYCIMAGEKAEASFAIEQALEFYSQALSALVHVDSSDSRMLGIQERKGDLQMVIGQFDGAIGTFQAARERQAEPESQARLLRKMGAAMEQMGDYKEAIETLGQAEAIVEHGTPEHGRILLSHGYPYLRMGEYDKARDSILEAIRIAEASGASPVDIGNGLRAVGSVYWSTGKYDLAKEHYEKSLAIMEKLDDKVGIAASLNNLGVTHDAQGELDLALDYYRRSLEVAKLIGNRLGIGMLLKNIGIAHMRLGQFDSALENYAQALDLQQKIGDKQGIASTEICMGNLNLSKGDLDLAMRHFSTSLAITRKIGDRRVEAISLDNLAEVFYYKGELERAEELFEKGMAISLDIGDMNERVYNRAGMSMVKLAQGKVQTAIDAAKESIEIATEIGATQEEGMARKVLGTALASNNDFAQAAEQFDKAEKILADIGDTKEMAKLLLARGQMLQMMGEHDAARKMMAEAEKRCTEMGMAYWQQKCQEALGSL